MANDVRTHRRPDGRCVVWPSGQRWTSDQARWAVEYGTKHRVTVITHLAADATDARRVLLDAGFVPARREAIVEIPLEGALDATGEARLPDGIRIRSAVDVDPDRLRLLDDELRDDIPGTFGWRSSPEEFASDTFEDPDFDPETYLVAVDTATGEYLGLVRVWMNPGGPRVGMIGVRRPYRRRGIARALLRKTLLAARAAGHVVATTEIDETNVASWALFERLELRRIGTTVEFSSTRDR